MTDLSVPDPGPLLIVGPVTWDRFQDRTVPGGAVTYAALVASAFGVRAHILVNAGPDADLAPLAGHEVHVIQGARTLTYEHRFHGRERQLRLVQAPGLALTPDHIPNHWPRPRTLVLGPLLTGDTDSPAFTRASQSEEIALLGQGLQRSNSENGGIRVDETPSESLTNSLNERVSLFLSADETDRWSARAFRDLTPRARRVVITHGRDGAELHDARGVTYLPARQANRLDPTGAGDVFATAFILAVRAGEHRAGSIAAAFAAASVERRGPVPLPPLQEIIATLDAPASDGVSRPNAR